MLHKLRKTLLTAALPPLAAAMLVGCSSGEDTPKKDTGDGRGGETSSAPAKDGSQPPLGKAAVKRALLRNGDIKGLDVEPVPGGEAAARLALAGPDAKPAACTPLVHMAAHTSEPAPKSRGAITASSKDGLVTSISLMGHESGDAARVIDDVRTAVKKCGDGFRDDAGKYENVVALPDPEQGDEGVSYRMKGTVDGELMPLTFTVVRSGSTLAVFFGTNLVDQEKTAPDPEVIRAQLAKLPG
ncbi:hypothetical protein ACF06W_31235 [Streptomyces albus]|uniref:hypothetical protein n=1 Tax=Streptomyces albus TaxID=1888 RepID=UPI003702CE1E